MLISAEGLAVLRSRIAALAFFRRHQLQWLEQTTSTSDDLKTAWNRSDFVDQIEVAEQQTMGRGQYGRRWKAEPGQCLMFSFSAVANPCAFPLSLLAGAALMDALADSGAMNEDLWLKWPNDVWCGRRKMAGILTESCLCGDTLRCIIGVGVNMTPLKDDSIAAGCVADFAPGITHAELLYGFCASWDRLHALDDKQQQKIWSEYAASFWNTHFLVSAADEPEFAARPVKINPDGSLLMEKETGSQQLVLSATLKPVF